MFLGRISFVPVVQVQMQDTRGAEFSRFLPLVTDEGESQAVGGPACSLFQGIRECEVPIRSLSLYALASHFSGGDLDRTDNGMSHFASGTR